MFKLLKRKIHSQRGAMDKVIVTLLFIVIGISAVVGIENWTSKKKNELYTKANAEYTNALK